MTRPEVLAIGFNVACGALNIVFAIVGHRRYKRWRTEHRDTVVPPMLKTVLAPLFTENFVVRQALLKLAAQDGLSVVVDRGPASISVRIDGLGDFAATFADVDMILSVDDGQLTVKGKGTGTATAPEPVIAEPSHEVH